MAGGGSGGGFFDNIASALDPQGSAQRAALPVFRAEQQQKLGEMSALSKLIGGFDPLAANGGRAPDNSPIQWNPRQLATDNDMVNFTNSAPPVDQTLNPGMRNASMVSLPSFLTDRQTPSALDQVKGIAAQAFPQAATASLQARLFPAPIGKLPAGESYFGPMDPTTGKAPLYAQAAPLPPDNLRMIQGLQATIQQLGPGTPAARPYEDQLTKLNYVPDMDPLKRAELQASINEKGAQAGLAGARQNLIGNTGLDPDTIEFRAQMAAAGDMDGAFKGIPNSIYGSPARAAISQRAAQIAQANGGTGADQAARNVALFGDKAAARAAGTQAAKMDMLATESQQFAQQALDASAKVPRSDFVPITKAEQMIQSGTSSPELAQFVAANTSLVNAYSAIAGRGTPTVAGQEHAYKVLSTAMGPEAYKAAVQQLMKEMEAARASPRTVQQDQQKAIAARVGQQPGATVAPSGLKPGDKVDALPPGATLLPDGRAQLPDGTILRKQ